MGMPLSDIYWLLERMNDEREETSARHKRAIDEVKTKRGAKG